jgi:AcrR family transcriptional regulator
MPQISKPRRSKSTAAALPDAPAAARKPSTRAAPRLNQQQRTGATIDLLVRSATRLFGERGYANTSLEDIALDCGLTIGAIYHHFGNKKALFAAANEAAERRIIDCVESATDNFSDNLAKGVPVAEGEVLQLFQKRWRALLNLCNEPGFRRIVLIDSPNVLGRDRWTSSDVTKSMQALSTVTARRSIELELALRIMRGAAAEAILALAEADNSDSTRRVVDAVINRLLTTVAEEFSTESR